jgi:hypothetical protein
MRSALAQADDELFRRLVLVYWCRVPSLDCRGRVVKVLRNKDHYLCTYGVVVEI